MPQISANWAATLEPILFEIYDNHTAKLPDHVKTLFNVMNSKKAVETALGRGSIGMMQPWTSTNSQVHYDEIAAGHEVTFRHEKYSNGLQIERELYDDTQYSEIRAMAEDLSFSAYYTRQYHGASLFNNAFSSARLGPDSKALCANDHSLVPGSSVTVDNLGALALTADNVETTRNAMKAWTDDRGNIVPSKPDTILVPPALRKAALIIADSDKEPDTADNNVNIWRGSLNVIEWDMLTDTNAWFLIDSAKMKRDLIWWDRRLPKMERDGTFDFDTEIAKWKTVGRWAYGWKTPLWVYGNNPS